MNVSRKWEGNGVLVEKDLRRPYGYKKNGLEAGINRVKKAVPKSDCNRNERHFVV